jgi:hypothetical protein
MQGSCECVYSRASRGQRFCTFSFLPKKTTKSLILFNSYHPFPQLANTNPYLTFHPKNSRKPEQQACLSSTMHFPTTTTLLLAASAASAAALPATNQSANPSTIARRAVSGKSTFYGGNVQGGTCSFSTYKLPAGLYGTAFSGQAWDSAANCGGCVKVSHGGKSIVAMVRKNDSKNDKGE